MILRRTDVQRAEPTADIKQALLQSRSSLVLLPAGLTTDPTSCEQEVVGFEWPSFKQLIFTVDTSAFVAVHIIVLHTSAAVPVSHSVFDQYYRSYVFHCWSRVAATRSNPQNFMGTSLRLKDLQTCPV